MIIADLRNVQFLKARYMKPSKYKKTILKSNISALKGDLGQVWYSTPANHIRHLVTLPYYKGCGLE